MPRAEPVTMADLPSSTPTLLLLVVLERGSLSAVRARGVRAGRRRYRVGAVHRLPEHAVEGALRHRVDAAEVHAAGRGGARAARGVALVDRDVRRDRRVRVLVLL